MLINEENDYILALKSMQRNELYKRNRLKKRKILKFFLFLLLVAVFIFIYILKNIIANKNPINNEYFIKIRQKVKNNILNKNKKKNTKYISNIQSYKNFNLDKSEQNNLTHEWNLHKNKTKKFYTPPTYGNISYEISFNYTEAINMQYLKHPNYTKINSFPKDKKKFAMCSIGKLENLNVRDFIIYYLELGVDKFFIYDNNEKYGEKIEDVVKDFIDLKFVEVYDIRGNQTSNPQAISYENCYHSHINEFDWFMFFDFDEYLYIKSYTLNDFVNLPMFKNCHSIIYYWRAYTDNNQVYYSIESPVKRFTVHIPDYMQRYMLNEKSMSRGGIKELTHLKSVHAPFFKNDTYNTKYMTCNAKGNVFDKFKIRIKENEITYENAFLKHFHWRSTEEYCLKLAIRKYYKNYNWKKGDYYYLRNRYLSHNKRTPEKESLFKKFFYNFSPKVF